MRGKGPFLKKGLPFPLKLPLPSQKRLAGSLARSRVAQAVRDSPSPGMMKEGGERHGAEARGLLPRERGLAAAHAMRHATDQAARDGAPSGAHEICWLATVFSIAHETGPVSPGKGGRPCFFIHLAPAAAYGLAAGWRQAAKAYGLGYWRMCEKMLPSRSSPCWAALAYQRADSVAFSGTPKPTS